MTLEWREVDPAEETKVFGDPTGAQATIHVFEIDGERDYIVECLCAVCHEIREVGLESFDVDKDMEPGVYFVKHHVEVYHHHEYSPEYDTWIEVNEAPNETPLEELGDAGV